MFVEDLTGRLKVVEDRWDLGGNMDGGGRLLLTEEEWLARSNDKQSGSFFPSIAKGGQDQNRGRDKQASHRKGSSGGKEAGTSAYKRDKSKVKCFNCNVNGHFAKECRKPRRERKEQVNLTQVQDEEPTLLMAQVCVLTEAREEMTEELILNEVHAQVYLGREEETQDGLWYLDTGASNHMFGSKENFVELDTAIRGKVKFGDGSVIDICGRGAVMFTCNNGEHRILTDIY